MNKKLNNWPCLARWVVCLLLMFPAVCFASRQPRWIQEYMGGTFKLPGFYYGIRYSSFKGDSPNHEERELARKRAINDLSYRLSVSIKSSFEEHLSQKGSFADEKVQSSLVVTTRLVLSGVQPKKSWTDLKKQLYWVMVVLDKTEADKQVKQQNFINEVTDRLESKQDEVLEGIKIIGDVLAQRQQTYEDRMASIQKEIERLGTSQNAKMEELVRQNKEVIRQNKEVMRQNKRLINRFLHMLSETKGATPTPPSIPTKQWKYVASRKSKKFHYPDCEWANEITQENLIGFKSRQEAEKSGRRLCSICNIRLIIRSKQWEYVASKKPNVFHRPDCKWAKKISPKNLIGFKSREQALNSGRRPCKVCKP